MNKILLGFIGIGLLTFVGCKKDEGNTSTNSNNTNSNNTNSTNTNSSIQYGNGATDADGNTYQSVIIGTQEWMVENLRTTKYSDGTAIPNVTINTDWGNLSTGAWCHYNNDNQYDTIYGKLYNFHAVETGKLCPTGWHVPTDAEWAVLNDYLGANGHSGTEGTALKATSGWSGGNGTDDYGFLGLPGGYRSSNGYFSSIGGYGSWLSSSQSNTSNAWYRYLYSTNDNVNRDYYSKTFGFSVRCLRD